MSSLLTSSELRGGSGRRGGWAGRWRGRRTARLGKDVGCGCGLADGRRDPLAKANPVIAFGQIDLGEVVVGHEP